MRYAVRVQQYLFQKKDVRQSKETVANLGILKTEWFQFKGLRIETCIKKNITI